MNILKNDLKSRSAINFGSIVLGQAFFGKIDPDPELGLFVKTRVGILNGIPSETCICISFNNGVPLANRFNDSMKDWTMIYDYRPVDLEIRVTGDSR
jgi:hypothetical protein